MIPPRAQAITRPLLALLTATLLAACLAPSPTPSFTPPPPTLSPSATPSLTTSPTPSPSLTFTTTPTRTQTPTPAPPRVVIISIDGLRPDALQQTAAPNLLGLAQRGAYSFLAQTTFPPVTLPSHVSMLTGYAPDAHGVDWNDYQPKRGPITSVPTIFTLAHNRGLRTVMVVGKEKFKHLEVPGSLDVFAYVTEGDQAVVNRAIAESAAGFDLLFVHLPNTDYFGHAVGWMSPTYLFQLTRTDEAIGRLLAALPKDAVVFVTADHGGHGALHGANIPEDMTIPWIMAGPGVRENYALTQPVITMDTAATAAHLLGFPLPPEAAGRPVLEAFEETPASPASTLTPTPAAAVRLLFTGDINPGRCPAEVARRNNDYTLSFQAVADELRAADLTIGSLDGALSDISPPSPCPQTKNLIGPARMVEGLVFAGFDVITVATNHAKDCGRLGFGCDDQSFLDTLHHLTEAGLLPVGGGDSLATARAPVIVERAGTRFAFIGLTAVGEDTWATASGPGTNPLSTETFEAVLADIASARAMADVVIVLPQWGVEYAEFPEAYQREWAQQMIAAGATLVVGNHPHTVQPLEAFPGGLAAYALGNFVFDQQPWRARQGVVLEAVFRGAMLESWQLKPVHIYSFYQPRWAEPDEAAQILARARLLP